MNYEMVDLYKNVKGLTIFTIYPFIARTTGAVIEVNQVGARPSVLARVAKTFVDI